MAFTCDWICGVCGEEQEIYHRKHPEPHDAPTCTKCMTWYRRVSILRRDWKRGVPGIDYQEKGVFPYKDIQTGKTFYSRKEMMGYLKSKNLRPLDRSEASDHNQEILRHPGRKRIVMG